MKRVFLMVSVLAVMFCSCKKDDPEINNPTNGKTTAEFNPTISYGTMTDQDGNIYKTVTIGTQTWMAENLRTTKYNDGTPILNVTDDYLWERSKTGACCNYNNSLSDDTIATYGRLYNWYAVNTGKLAPAGWHVPTDDEWTTLINYLDESVASGKLRESGTTHWHSPNPEATNETGFTALPGGSGHGYGTFRFMGYDGFWWTASESNEKNALFLNLEYAGNDIFRLWDVKASGKSVRCIKD